MLKMYRFDVELTHQQQKCLLEFHRLHNQLYNGIIQGLVNKRYQRSRSGTVDQIVMETMKQSKFQALKEFGALETAYLAAREFLAECDRLLPLHSTYPILVGRCQYIDGELRLPICHKNYQVVTIKIAVNSNEFGGPLRTYIEWIAETNRLRIFCLAHENWSASQPQLSTPLMPILSSRRVSSHRFVGIDLGSQRIATCVYWNGQSHSLSDGEVVKATKQWQSDVERTQRRLNQVTLHNFHSTLMAVEDVWAKWSGFWHQKAWEIANALWLSFRQLEVDYIIVGAHTGREKMSRAQKSFQKENAMMQFLNWLRLCLFELSELDPQRVVYFQNEVQTSQASFLDRDEVDSGEYSGRRVGEIYFTKEGKRIHADVNAALNILEKSKKVDLGRLYKRSFFPLCVHHSTEEWKQAFRPLLMEVPVEATPWYQRYLRKTWTTLRQLHLPSRFT